MRCFFGKNCRLAQAINPKRIAVEEKVLVFRFVCCLPKGLSQTVWVRDHDSLSVVTSCNTISPETLPSQTAFWGLRHEAASKYGLCSPLDCWISCIRKDLDVGADGW